MLFLNGGGQHFASVGSPVRGQIAVKLLRMTALDRGRNQEKSSRCRSPRLVSLLMPAVRGKPREHSKEQKTVSTTEANNSFALNKKETNERHKEKNYRHRRDNN